jgi:hypothetical protein
MAGRLLLRLGRDKGMGRDMVVDTRSRRRRRKRREMVRNVSLCHFELEKDI